MKTIKTFMLALGLSVAPLATGIAMAEAATAPKAAATEAAPADKAAEEAKAAALKELYTPMKADPNVGLPKAAEINLQDQYSPTGKQARAMNDTFLTPVIFATSIFVLGLLLWTMVRYNKRANPVPSKTSHNTTIEVIWTLLPILILVIIAVPSFNLLKAQFAPIEEEAVAVKVTGYQWYWGYTYPDHGGFEVVSNMLSDEEAKKAGEPRLLGVDNRMVVPAGVPLRIQTTGADVIHSFAVPSLWFKLDSVPGRLNEKRLLIEKPGVYYGQCSELCGAKHAFMPIVVEALPKDKFEAWVKAQGGELPGAAKEAAAVPASAPPAPQAAVAPAAAPAPIAAEAPAAPAAAQ